MDYVIVIDCKYRCLKMNGALDVPRVNFYFLRTKTTIMWSLRIKSRTMIIRLDKINNWWRPKFITYKLQDLDLLGLYYEVGFVKIKDNKG
jgi:hypothetical protein